MKQGYRIIDTDTHVGPNMETFRLRRARRFSPAGTS